MVPDKSKTTPEEPLNFESDFIKRLDRCEIWNHTTLEAFAKTISIFWKETSQPNNNEFNTDEYDLIVPTSRYDRVRASQTSVTTPPVKFFEYTGMPVGEFTDSKFPRTIKKLEQKSYPQLDISFDSFESQRSSSISLPTTARQTPLYSIAQTTPHIRALQSMTERMSSPIDRKLNKPTLSTNSIFFDNEVPVIFHPKTNSILNDKEVPISHSKAQSVISETQSLPAIFLPFNPKRQTSMPEVRNRITSNEQTNFTRGNSLPFDDSKAGSIYSQSRSVSRLTSPIISGARKKRQDEVVLGKLGADIQSEDYIKKLENYTRRKQYAQKISQMKIKVHVHDDAKTVLNKTFMNTGRQSMSELVEAFEKRKRMADYDASIKRKESSRDSTRSVKTLTPIERRRDVIEEMQKLHLSDVERVNAIKDRYL